MKVTIEKALIEKASRNNVPLSCSLELLPLCNMNCDMCYVRLSKEEMSRLGRLRTMEEWLELAKHMKDSGVLFLLLTGGEPLLYPDFKQLYLGLKDMGMILTLNTNGTLINQEWASFFGEHKPRRINITLYGGSEETYRNLCHYPDGLTKTIQGIRLLKQYGVDVKISATMTKANQKDLFAIHKISKELDVPINVDTYIIPAVRERKKTFNQQVRLTPAEAAQLTIDSAKIKLGSEQFQQYAKNTLYEIDHFVPPEYHSGLSCLAGNCSFTINWQGKMRPCVMLQKPEIDVFETGFQFAWKYISNESCKISTCQKCCSCAKRTICRTCAASELFEEGKNEIAPNYLCQYTDELLKLLENSIL